MYEFPAARWPMVLKASSALVTLLVIGVEYGALKSIPATGPAHVVGLCVIWAIPFMLLTSILFIVTGFAIDQTTLTVHRVLWSTRFDLSGLRRFAVDPDAIKGAARLLGNGGLYSFSGIYRTKTLGRFRLFATDPSCAVILVRPAGTVVVTPADPGGFAARLGLLFPNAEDNRHEESRSTPDRRIHSIS